MGWPDKQMDGEKDRRTLPHVLSPCYAVDKYVINMVITLQLLTLEPHPKKLTLLASGVRLDPNAIMDFQSMNP